jgi:hypothetical protein
MTNEDLQIQIGANIDNLIKELNKSKNELSKFNNDVDKFAEKLKRSGEKIKNVGASMAKYITLPLVGLGALAVKTAGDFEKLQTSLNTAFQGNEKAAKSAFDQITKFAAETPFQVEQVASAFIKLKNMGLDPSQAALKSYGNTASAMGKSLDQMVEAVADAATGEFERLKEFGIRASRQGDKVSFTFKGVTKTVAMESAAIEGYLQKIGNVDFAGGMEAQSKTFFGRLSTLKDNVSLLMKDFGDIIFKYINPIIDSFSSMIKKFRELSPATKQIIVLVAAFSAALGPLLIALGVFTTTILPAMLAGLSVLISPITLVIGALVALGVAVYKNFDAVVESAASVYNSFVDIYNQSMILRGAISTIALAFKLVWIAGKLAFKNLWDIIKVFGKNVKELFGGLGNLIKGALTFDLDEFKKGLKRVATSVSSGFGEIKEELTKNAKEAGDETADAFGTALNETIGGTLEKTTPEKIKQSLSDMSDSVVGYAKEIGTKISNALGLGVSGGEEEGAEGAEGSGVVSAVKTQSEGVVNELNNLNEQAENIINNGISNTFGGLVDAIGGALASGGNVLKASGSVLLGSLGSILSQLGQMAIGIGIGIKAIKASLLTLNPLAAIGAGAALLALGSAFSAGAKKLGSTGASSSGSFSSNIGSSTSTGSSTNFGNSGSSSNSLQNVVFEIQGTKLVGVLSNTLNRNRSLNGTLSIN